jgi:Prolyl oligopeptidase family
VLHGSSPGSSPPQSRVLFILEPPSSTARHWKAPPQQSPCGAPLRGGCADDCLCTLTQERYTGPGRLAVWGRSAGGLTMGAAVTMAPELFQARARAPGLRLVAAVSEQLPPCFRVAVSSCPLASGFLWAVAPLRPHAGSRRPGSTMCCAMFGGGCQIGPAVSYSTAFCGHGTISAPLACMFDGKQGRPWGKR